MRISDWSSDVCSSDLFDAVRERIAAETTRPVLVVAQTPGSRDRLGALLREHGVAATNVEHWSQVQPKPGGAVLMAALDIERGFQFDGALVFGEQDIHGDRLARPARQRRPTEQTGDATLMGHGGQDVYITVVAFYCNTKKHSLIKL